MSPKAWMTVVDADLLEGILLQSARRTGELRVLEWGSGRSTLYYTGLLDRLGLPYDWTSLEYDRAFFEGSMLAPFRSQRGSEAWCHFPDRGETIRLRGEGGPGKVSLVSFPHAKLFPFLPGREADRHVDLDDYVTYPRNLGRRYDVMLIDGRKRRRCLIESLGLLEDGGLAVLHDAQRKYYHCAMASYPSGRFVGDELWVGGNGTAEVPECLQAAPARRRQPVYTSHVINT